MAIRVISTGSFVDGELIDNEYLSTIVDTDNQWIMDRTGISTRYMADGYTTEELGYEASKRCIEKCGVSASDIGIVVFATTTSDTVIPSSAFILAGQLGIDNAICFDINAACTGFLYALGCAKSMMDDMNIAYGLVVGSEKMTKLIDWTDRSTCILFGDGSGGVLLENTSVKSKSSLGGIDLGLFLSSKLEIVDISLGGKFDELNYLAVDPHEFDGTHDEGNGPFIRMNGRQVYKFATEKGAEVIKNILDKNNVSVEDICLGISHQANARIIKTLSNKTKIDFDKWFINLQKYGNTSSASIPLAMDEGLKNFDLYKNIGKYIISVGFGGGLSYGAILYRVVSN